MPTRNEVVTLEEAVRLYGVDAGWLPVLRDELEGKELRHLGEQPSGWFYNLPDVQAIQREIERQKQDVTKEA